MKLISWNVNGLRAVLGKGFYDAFAALGADVVCLQETKCSPDQVELELPGYHQYFNSAEKKGYSGTAVFTKEKPLSVSYGMGMEEHDHEGRIITAEYPGFYLVNVYTPNAKRDLSRLAYRCQCCLLYTSSRRRGISYQHHRPKVQIQSYLDQLPGALKRKDGG